MVDHGGYYNDNDGIVNNFLYKLMTQLRPFQQQATGDIYAAWAAGARNVLFVLATGGGKTVVFSDIIAEHRGASVVIAHRQEIVTQISLALARNGVRHKIIGQAAVSRACTRLHLYELQRNYVEPRSNVAVAGVDTLVRMPNNDSWMQSVGLVVQDEAHHVLRANKWGKASSMFPNARTLGVTATPIRADGQGLGAHHDGIMDTIILGPSMRDLITDGWLTEYRIFSPPNNIELKDVPLSASGDFSPVKLAEAVHKSTIVGDVVTHYKKIAPGKLGVTFAVDVQSATHIAAMYRSGGIPAEIVSANTPDVLRSSILRRFRAREILQLVNVDLFGEGFDLPAIEVVSMARPTQSYSLFAQQFGRALRPMDGKRCAIIIDHASNVHRHGLPDAPKQWTLDRREKKSKSQIADIPVRTCPACLAAYEAITRTCPFCHYETPVIGRSTAAEVEGDLYELDLEALARLRGEIDAPPNIPYSAPPEVIGAIKKRHREKQEVQANLRDAIAAWAGHHSQNTDKNTISQMQRRFFLQFGIDVASAQALGKSDALQLRERIENEKRSLRSI